MSQEENKSKRVVIVGIPGVGKSSVVGKVVEVLKSRGAQFEVVNFGTMMMEKAADLHGVRSRDEIRKLPIDVQRRLQIHAANEISKLEKRNVIVDTHLFIATSEGFWPGMPMDVLQALRPTNLVMVVATPEEIIARRQNDSSRARDAATRETLELELSVADAFLYSSSLVVGCPALVVNNRTGGVSEAAEKIINAALTG